MAGERPDGERVCEGGDVKLSVKKAGEEQTKTITVSNVLLALIGTLFIFCASVYLVLNIRQIYYFDIDFLKIEEEVGLDDWIIRENYDILINYNLITGQVRELQLPSFPMSDTGKVHFEEVRRIFFAIQYAGAVCLLLFAAGFARKVCRRDFECLRLMALFSVVIPLTVGTAIAVSWRKVFVIFHELVFQNDYWIFDPVTDPVINILPDEFFFHCAAAILLFILIGSAASGILYRMLTQIRRRK